MQLTTASVADVERRLANVEAKLGDSGKRVFNDMQLVVVKIVAQFVMAELAADSNCSGVYEEPLRWLLHSGPGIGKSHVIKIMKHGLFEEFV